jgi:hypothetical protein
MLNSLVQTYFKKSKEQAMPEFEGLKCAQAQRSPNTSI